MEIMWSEWSSFEKLMICTAALFTVIFIFQFILTMIGASIDHDIDGVDFSNVADGSITDSAIGDTFLHIFSIRNMTSFFSCLGWTAFFMKSYDYSDITSLIAGIIVGAISMSLNIALMKVLSKLSEDNSFRIESTVGAFGKVYTPIKHGKTGLVQITYGGGLHELHAKSDEDLESHTPVEVVDVIGTNIVIVKSL